MKNITLIRHGKASQDFGFKDFDRPLLTVGIENSKTVAHKFYTSLKKENTIYSSSAKRASETAITFAKCLKIDINLIIFKDELYTFDAYDLAKIIKSTSNVIENLIIFGHNGAITDFVNKFGDIYIDNVPTSGLVTIQFETNDWKSISKGKTIQTLFPSQLQ
jgi:phosphohistidine phosphatase